MTDKGRTDHGSIIANLLRCGIAEARKKIKGPYATPSTVKAKLLVSFFVPRLSGF